MDKRDGGGIREGVVKIFPYLPGPSKKNRLVRDLTSPFLNCLQSCIVIYINLTVQSSESCNKYDIPVDLQSISMHSQTERNGQVV